MRTLPDSMDPSVKRVLEALLPGPALPRILINRYGMSHDEAVEALTHAVHHGLAQPVGPHAYGLTDDGERAASEQLDERRYDHARGAAADLHRRAQLLERQDTP